ncbi:hypothetical protein H2248_010800 [Termitomyces sp. 'cryptogamus']|nr:hypothetical protein H2248_010800 [Termitomyces sp. 'cryptogamus']
MTTLDLQPRLQVTSCPVSVLERANTTSRYDEHTYEHLLKDIPYNKKGVPYITTDGYFRKLVVSIGRLTWKRGLNPVEALLEQTDSAWLISGQDCTFEITGEFTGTAHWPPGLGFQRLGEFLLFLGNEQMGYERWHKLTISLPDIELPYDGPSLPILPLDAFTNLLHLTWKGHRKQLVVSWLPLVPSVLRTLTTLEIQCDIALQDCCYLLYHGRNLKKVTLKIIQKDLAHEQVLGFFTPPVCTNRPLEDLCLVSDDDIGPLLRPFNFPSLHCISFTLGYLAWSTLADLKIWKTLQKIHIKGHFTDEDCDWIRFQCSPTTQCDFQRPRLPVRGATSFLHKDLSHRPFFTW